MEYKDMYKVWSPAKNPWTRWTKPVAFMNLKFTKIADVPIQEIELDVKYQSDVIYIVDLEQNETIDYALALAKVGYQPVALFNGASAPTKYITLDNDRLYRAIIKASDILKDIRIYEKANPVFLLDSQRLSDKGPKSPGYFDNRWAVFKQDVPTPEYLIEKGITRIYLFHKTINVDMQHILYEYQKNKIKVFDAVTKKELVISKPSAFNSLSYRAGIILGLRRNAAGGFGGIIPDVYESSSSSGGRRYYGIG